MAAAGGLLLATHISERLAAWDVSAFRGLRLLADHPHLAGLAQRLVQLPDPLPTTAMLAAICAAGLVAGRRGQVGAALLLVGGASLTTYAMKAALAHPRYRALLGIEALSSNAYPSGHTTAAMALGLAGVLVAPPRWRPAAAVGAAWYGVAVGISLVMLGRHYPSDVIGAFLVSGSFGLLTVAVLRAFEREPKASPALGWPLRARAEAGDGALLGICAALGGGALLLALTRADAIGSYASAHTSAVAAGCGIALASTLLVYGIAAEANEA